MSEYSNRDFLEQIERYDKCSFCSRPIPVWRNVSTCSEKCRGLLRKEFQKTLDESLIKGDKV